MWDLNVSVPDHCLSFYFARLNMYSTWKCKSGFVVHYLHFCICIYVIVFWAGGLYYLNKLLTYLLMSIILQIGLVKGGP